MPSYRDARGGRGQDRGRGVDHVRWVRSRVSTPGWAAFCGPTLRGSCLSLFGMNLMLSSKSVPRLYGRRCCYCDIELGRRRLNAASSHVADSMRKAKVSQDLGSAFPRRDHVIDRDTLRIRVRGRRTSKFLATQLAFPTVARPQSGAHFCRTASLPRDVAASGQAALAARITFGGMRDAMIGWEPSTRARISYGCVTIVRPMNSIHARARPSHVINVDLAATPQTKHQSAQRSCRSAANARGSEATDAFGRPRARKSLTIPRTSPMRSPCGSHGFSEPY